MNKPSSYFARLRRPRKVRSSKAKTPTIDRSSSPAEPKPPVGPAPAATA